MILYNNFTAEELTVSVPIEDKDGDMLPIVTAGYTKMFERILRHCNIQDRFTRREDEDEGNCIAWCLTEDPDMVFSVIFGKMYNQSSNNWTSYKPVIENTNWAGCDGVNLGKFGYPRQISYTKSNNYGKEVDMAQARRNGENVEFRLPNAANLRVAVFNKFIVIDVIGLTNALMIGLTNNSKGYFVNMNSINTNNSDAGLHVSGTTAGGVDGDGNDYFCNNIIDDRTEGNGIMAFPALFTRLVASQNTSTKRYYGNRPHDDDGMVILNKETLGCYLSNVASSYDEVVIGDDTYIRVRGSLFAKGTVVIGGIDSID